MVRGVISGSRKYLRRVRPVPTQALFDSEADPRDTTNLWRDDLESRARLASRLDSYLAQRTSGIHLRILNEPGREPASGEAVLRTAGRFVDVSGSLLEDGSTATGLVYTYSVKEGRSLYGIPPRAGTSAHSTGRRASGSTRSGSGTGASGTMSWIPSR